MIDIYLFIIIALAILAIADLIIGVSNDAVNFLNSAIGSKAVSFKTVMITASAGVAIGAIFSSGLMEVARKGIFNPNEFMFNEIMIIFLAVMVTDILLLDFFNTLGMPTSTTVSIVFELLGAAVAIALIKIFNNSDQNITHLIDYINTSQATTIILGIILSVVIAFSIGAFVQWTTRLLLSYDFDKRKDWVGALFGGIALTCITYFIFVKGIKGTPYANETFSFTGNSNLKTFIESNVFFIVSISLVIWSSISYLVTSVLKRNIYKLIILVGTFALALAFSGNDLVNFIGVPITAFESYNHYVDSGLPANELSMSFLTGKVNTPTYLLLIAGIIMVATLWFSSKAKDVVKTSLDLSSQSDTKERFKPNFLSRLLVRTSIVLSQYFNAILPNSWKYFIEKRFNQPKKQYKKDADAPAFDMLRAAVNLMVAAVLISIATSMKLPLSTTYVTFMVTMGTSLADRAWGADSAVYRVAGVLNVVGGWFFTALIAFTASGVIAYLLNINLQIMMPVLLLIAFTLIVRNYIAHRKKTKEASKEENILKAESKSIQGVVHESAGNIAKVINRGNRIYTNSIEGLSKQDLSALNKNKKQVIKLSNDVNQLRDNIFYFIKNLEESSIAASNFYINILSHLQDMTQSLEYVSSVSHKHINNNHKRLTFTQIKELKEVDSAIEKLFINTSEAFEQRSFEKIGGILESKNVIQNLVTEKIQKQVERTRTVESSPKNTTLHFGILLETRDLLKSMMNLLEEYHNSHDGKIPNIPSIKQ